MFYMANGIEKLPKPFDATPPLSSDPNIFFTAVGRSFFEQVCMCLVADSCEYPENAMLPDQDACKRSSSF